MKLWLVFLGHECRGTFLTEKSAREAVKRIRHSYWPKVRLFTTSCKLELVQTWRARPEDA